MAAYTAITGNSILSLIGLQKASENYEEKSVDISSEYNTIIENNYTKIEMKKIACDQTFFIMEYNVTIKDEAIDIINKKDENYISDIEYNYSQGGKCEDLGLVSTIYINGKYMQGYTYYSTKIEETENEYKFFEIVDLTGVTDKKINATIEVMSLNYNKYAFPVTDTNNAYVMEFSINNENESRYEEQKFESEKCEMKIKNIVNTDFASYVTFEFDMKNKNEESYLNNFDISSKDFNGIDVESKVFLKKYIVTTKNGNTYDIINDNNIVYKYEQNRYILDSDNLEIAAKKIRYRG
ncbi:MAG: hypothetical protein IJH12_00885 [Clostridia bacterium]|nr:hypothetical protein [Clostridia bacterium]